MSNTVRSFVEELLLVWRARRPSPTAGKMSINIRSQEPKRAARTAPHQPVDDHRLRSSQL